MWRFRLRQAAVCLAFLGLLSACAGGESPRARPADATPGTLTGKLLVAAPRIPDSRFSKTLVLVVWHSEKGAMGLVVNRAIGRGPVAELLRRTGHGAVAGKGEVDISYGGPVKPRTAYVLHSPEYADRGTIRVSGEVSMSSSARIMRNIAAGEGPKRAMFLLGHAGWLPGQLDAEIRRKYWVVVPSGADLVFGPGHGRKWLAALRRRGLEL